MRIRAIKPEFWTDARVGEWDARRALFFVGLWQVADDAGRLRLDPRLIRAELDPFDAKFGGVDGVTNLLEELVQLGRVLVYEAEGQRLGLVAHFAEHQVINRPSKSRLPAPPEGLRESSVSPPGGFTPKVGVEGKGREGIREQGSGSGAEACAEPADAAPAPASPSVCTLPCVGKGQSTFDVTQDQVAEWSRAFPGVDVAAELLKARAWLNANPSKRKTHKGVPRFLVSWLGRAQNNSRGTAPSSSSIHGSGEARTDDRVFVGFASDGFTPVYRSDLRDRSLLPRGVPCLPWEEGFNNENAWSDYNAFLRRDRDRVIAAALTELERRRGEAKPTGGALQLTRSSP